MPVVLQVNGDTKNKEKLSDSDNDVISDDCGCVDDDNKKES